MADCQVELEIQQELSQKWQKFTRYFIPSESWNTRDYVKGQLQQVAT